ncbi:hypothetical protein [Bacillus infantis]|uniref:hypothetical protein n=1 Tax=Bacillus infantis TaxID=324767 RepID=UPI00209E34B4|nr:hypothetical protein [Bacillus infantis]MCP1159325.1 hypothetical protein [Bacillus infantis]
MNTVTIESLQFVEEAKNVFTNNDELTTYRNEEETFIALRGGFREDCITVYELGNPVGMFTEQLPKQHKVLVDYDYLEKYKNLKDKLLPEVEKAEELIHLGSDVDFNKGIVSTVKYVLNMLR